MPAPGLLLDPDEELYLAIDAAIEHGPEAPPRLSVLSDEDLYLAPRVAALAAALPPQEQEWHQVAAGKFGHYGSPWYFGAISREVADLLVTACDAGSFAVRASIKSKRRRGYAVTVCIDRETRKSLHIAVEIDGDGAGCSVDAQKFETLKAVVDCFSVHKYKDLVMLRDPVPRSALAGMMQHSIAHMHAEPGTPNIERKLPPPVVASPPAVPDRTETRPESPVYSALRTGSNDGYEVPKLIADRARGRRTSLHEVDFEGAHIYASCVSDDDIDEEYEEAAGDGMYAALGPADPATADTPISRARTVKRLPLPDIVTHWTTAEVQRWLAENDLACFKKPFYNNGITGLELISCQGSQFPKARFTQEQCDAFDVALAVAATATAGK